MNGAARNFIAMPKKCHEPRDFRASETIACIFRDSDLVYSSRKLTDLTGTCGPQLCGACKWTPEDLRMKPCEGVICSLRPPIGAAAKCTSSWFPSNKSIRWPWNCMTTSNIRLQVILTLVAESLRRNRKRSGLHMRKRPILTFELRNLRALTPAEFLPFTVNLGLVWSFRYPPKVGETNLHIELILK